jgi:hypothetical protein
MAKSRTFASGTVVILTAKANISSGDPALLQYSWRKDGTVVSNITTSGTATLSTLTAGVYDVVVSHPNADSVTSESFTILLRGARPILRITKVKGSSINSNGSFPSSEQFDWNLSSSAFEAKSESSGLWQVYAKEQDISVDIEMKGSSGQGYNFASSGGGDGGVGTIRYTLQKGVIHTLRIGSRKRVTADDPENNSIGGGRVFSGKGGYGGGSTLLYRGGTLISVVGGGGGNGIDSSGGSGGGLNVAGEAGNGRNGGLSVQSVPPIDIGDNKTDNSNYPTTGVRTVGRCVNNSTGQQSCATYLSDDGDQNNGGFGYLEGGSGGSGVKGGNASVNRDGGAGGSGWASSAVSVLSTQLGGNISPNNGSIKISRVTST